MDAIVRGSVAHMARQANTTLARAWTNVDLVIVLDVSSSMSARDNTPDTRIARAQRAVENVMARYPGRIAMILFGERARLNVDGVLPRAATDCTTIIAPALTMLAQIAPRAGGARGLIVTDGGVYDLNDALAVAAGECPPCDGLFVGDPGDAQAQAALAAICRATGGRSDIDVAPAPALELIAQRLLAAPS